MHFLCVRSVRHGTAGEVSCELKVVLLLPRQVLLLVPSFPLDLELKKALFAVSNGILCANIGWYPYVVVDV